MGLLRHQALQRQTKRILLFHSPSSEARGSSGKERVFTASDPRSPQERGTESVPQRMGAEKPFHPRKNDSVVLVAAHIRKPGLQAGIRR